MGKIEVSIFSVSLIAAIAGSTALTLTENWTVRGWLYCIGFVVLSEVILAYIGKSIKTRSYWLALLAITIIGLIVSAAFLLIGFATFEEILILLIFYVFSKVILSKIV